MNYNTWTDAQLEERANQILTEMNGEGANLEELRSEAAAISEERTARAAEANRREIRNSIAGGAGMTMSRPAATQQRTFGAGSDEYRRAWLKQLATSADGIRHLGELTEEERTAFITTTANTGSVVPDVILNEIIDCMDNRTPILNDAYKTAFTQGFGVPRRTGITKGDSAGVAEGAARGDDEQNAFELLPLSGIEIKKHVVLSRKMKFKSIEAFEAWLVKELGERQMVAKEAVCIARMKGAAPDGGSAVTAAGIAAANKNTSVARTDAGVRGMMALVVGANKTIYANAATIWNIFAGIEDGGGHRLFVPSGMDDPTVKGYIYGAKIKEDPNVGADEFFILAEDELQVNDYDELEIFSAVEPKTANEIKTAYSLTDAGMRNPVGGAYGKFVAAS